MTSRAKILALLISLISIVAIGVSAYLVWASLQSQGVAGCGGSSMVDCDEVLSSRWSRWLGVPVSLFGLLTYLGILALAWPAAKQDSSRLLTLLLSLALMAAGSAAWFVGLQIFIVQSFCLYCIVVHLCGVLIGVLTLLIVQGNSGGSDYGQMRSLLGIESDSDTPDSTVDLFDHQAVQPLIAITVASAALSILMVGQFLHSSTSLGMDTYEEEILAGDETVAEELDSEGAEDEPGELGFELAEESDEGAGLDDNQAYSPGEVTAAQQDPSSASDSRFVKFNGLSKAVDIRDLPLLGKPTAKHVILEMIDYTCLHCRKLHPHLKAALDRYGNQLAFAVYHTPLSKKCNPGMKKSNASHFYSCDYAELAISLWQAEPKSFPAFHDWLLETAKAPSVVQARERALLSVGDRVLIDDKIGAKSTRRLAVQGQVLLDLKGTLPMLFTTKGVIKGFPGSEQEWFKFLEAQLGIEPVDP